MEATCNEFESALRKGLGRAMILLRNSHNSVELQDILLHGCIVNQVYDWQCEEERAHYLYQLIVETGNVESYREKLFQALWSDKDEFEEIDKAQIFGVLCCIAAGGFDQDRLKLRDFLMSADYAHVGRNCLHRFVLLEGFDGFSFCMRAFYHHLIDTFDDNGWVIRSLINTLNDRDGQVVTAAALRAARFSSPELNELLTLSDKQNSAIPSEPDIVLDYATAKSVFDPRRGFRRSWIKAADAAELKMAADDLLNECDEQTTWRYLQIFGTRDFPNDPSQLFRYIKSKNKRVSYAALGALGRITHPKIRELALETISDGTKLELAIRLLGRNFQSGDLARVQALLDGVDLDDEAWHGIGMATLGLLRSAAVPPTESRCMLVKLYEQTPCSLCRGHFVEELRDAHSVPDWMANEARFDAEPETVALFRTQPEANEEA